MRIDALTSYVPTSRLSVRELVEDNGGDAREAEAFSALFGMNSVACAAGTRIDAILCDLLNGLGEGPFDEGLGVPAQVLVHVHAQPIGPRGTLPPPASLRGLHPLLDHIETVIEMDQQNCASGFFALATIERLLARDWIASAFVLFADDLSDWAPRFRYVPGSTVLGDGFALMKVGVRPGGVRIGPVATDYDPCFAAGLAADGDQARRFNQAQLDMIVAMMASTGFRPEAGDRLFPHNINGLTFRLLARRLKLDADRIHVDLVAEAGHCCCADPFITLDRFLREGETRDLRNAGFAGTTLSVGMGGFVGAAMVRRAPVALSTG